MVVEELYLSYTSTDLKDPWLEINPILTTIKEVYGLRILWILNKVQALLPAGSLTQHGGLALFGDHKGEPLGHLKPSPIIVSWTIILLGIVLTLNRRAWH